MNLRKFFGLGEKRDAVTPQSFFSGALPFGSNYASQSALNVSAFFAGVNLISNSIAMLPIKVLIKDSKGRNELSTHPVNIVFGNKDNDCLLSRFTLLKLIVKNVITKGNAFAYIMRGQDGTVMGLRYLEPSDVLVYYDKKKDLLWYDIPILGKRHVEPIDILHFVMFTNDGINGISLLTYCSRSLGIANASENAARAFFENGLNVSGILRSTTPISQKQKDEIKTNWQNTYSNGGGLVVLNSNLEYQQISLSPEDSQLLASREFNVEDIARFLGLDPSLIGGKSGASYTSLEMMQNSFLVHTLMPYVAMIESELNRKLLKPSENNLEIILETSEILRIDKSSQASYYKTMIDSGILSCNEIRKELGYSSIDGGDKVRVAYSDISQNTVNGDSNNNDQTTEEDEEDIQ